MVGYEERAFNEREHVLVFLEYLIKCSSRRLYKANRLYRSVDCFRDNTF